MTPEARNFLQSIANVIKDACEGAHPNDGVAFQTAATMALATARELPTEISEAVGTRFQSPTSTSTNVAHDARVFWRAIIDEILRN